MKGGYSSVVSMVRCRSAVAKDRTVKQLGTLIEGSPRVSSVVSIASSSLSDRSMIWMRAQSNRMGFIGNGVRVTVGAR